MSAGYGRCGYRYIDNSHSSSRNFGVCHCGDWSGDNGKGIYMSQDTIPYSYHNIGSKVDVDQWGVYISQTRHSSSNNPGDHGILFCLSIAYHFFSEFYW